ncbi:hypothetical protein GGE08_002194 [Muricauda sp. ARW1Y1]|nr:hypothetical protein [Muricauda sp. ARW1Y1]
MWSCKKDDQSSQQVNLLFTENNLAGDWKRIAEFSGQPNDSLGILEPLEDLFAQFENCRKDDIIRYVKGDCNPPKKSDWFELDKKFNFNSQIL